MRSANNEWPESAAAAVPLLEAALAARPDDVTARECQRVALARLKDREGALKEFKALLEFDPPNRDDLIRRFAILAPAGGQKP
jgi:tetratricopeptide (TPR) repeat protein